jgi:hypothetical protein
MMIAVIFLSLKHLLSSDVFLLIPAFFRKSLKLSRWHRRRQRRLILPPRLLASLPPPRLQASLPPSPNKKMSSHFQSLGN